MEVTLTKRFVKHIIDVLKFFHTRLIAFLFPLITTFVTHSDSVGLGTLRT